ncbi:leucine-rich repeat protein [Artemisia annua]|uniref:Leucine-rich repeat protein n=1 Tax=Artemisia annua TaxID=35608 RepID=A0A2U1Q5Q0_ARTAN|nr:leucine-rich repeat protein [Artemisia annua]
MTVWFYLDIFCGFVTGFWGAIGALFFKTKWRQKILAFAEAAVDKIHVRMVTIAPKMKRRNIIDHYECN